jgi:hypothetical protein
MNAFIRHLLNYFVEGHGNTEVIRNILHAWWILQLVEKVDALRMLE